MAKSVTFKASLYRVSQDREGESRVTFEVPLSDLERILTLGRFTGQLLTVIVEADEE